MFGFPSGSDQIQEKIHSIRTEIQHNEHISFNNNKTKELLNVYRVLVSVLYGLCD